MFESDKNDLQDEIAQLSQPGPSGSNAGADPHDSSFYEDAGDDGQGGPPPRAKKPFPWVIAGFGVLALVLVYILYANRPKSTTAVNPPGDMGQGVNAASGLRGHLVTQWTGDKKTGKLQYQLRIEPLMLSEAPGFALVTARPLAPYSINVRLMDANGFALCGKEILFHYDPTRSAPPLPDAPQPRGKRIDAAKIAADRAAARQSQIDGLKAAEAERERGKDMLEPVAGSDGMVSAVTAQGDLPCSAELYQRANYWDLTTNFPTIPEQEALRDPNTAKLEHEKELNQDQHKARRKAVTKPMSAYFIQGDDRVTGYDAKRSLLEAEAGKRFVIDKRADEGTVTRWASNYSLIHYRCDQHASCALTAAGGQAPVRARLNE